MRDEEWGGGESSHETHGVADAVRDFLSARRPTFEFFAHNFTSSTAEPNGSAARYEARPL